MRNRMGTIALATALAFGIQGCYGSFALTRKLWKWNGSLGNKFVNELVFLVIGAVLPVYGIAAFIDGVIINSVEFWSGKNPMMSKVIVEGDKMVKMQGREDGSVQVSVFEKGKLTGETVLKKTENGIVAMENGKVVYTAGADMNGVPTLANAQGVVMAQSVAQ